MYNSINNQKIHLILNNKEYRIWKKNDKWVLPWDFLFWSNLILWYSIRLSFWCKCVSHSVVSDSATPWTIAYQASLFMGFSRQEYWSGLPCPLPGDLPNLGIKPGSPALQADSLPSEPRGWVKGIIKTVTICVRFGEVWKHLSRGVQ